MRVQRITITLTVCMHAFIKSFKSCSPNSGGVKCHVAYSYCVFCYSVFIASKYNIPNILTTSLVNLIMRSGMYKM